MHSIRIFLQTLIATLLAVYVALAFALETTSVQEVVAEKVSAQLEEAIGSRVSIKSVSIGLFNSVELHDVTIYDQQEEPMLESGLIYGKFRILPLFNGHIFLRNISLLDGSIRLSKASAEEDANYQFLVDLFKTGKQRKPIHLTINSLLLRRCTIAYDENYHPVAADGRFSPHHIGIEDIDANLSLKELTDEGINLRVRHLTFKERSGFELVKLRLHLLADRRHCSIHDLVLDLPASHLHQKSLEADYDFKDRETFRQTFTLKADLQDVLLSTNDLVPFLPSVAPLDETVRCSANAMITSKHIALEKLNISNERRTFSLNTSVHVGNNPNNLTASVKHLNCEIQQALVEACVSAFSAKPIPVALSALGSIALKGDAEVSVPRLAPAAKAALSDEDRQSFMLKHSVARFDGTVASEIGHLATTLSYKSQQAKLELSSRDANLSNAFPHKLSPVLLDFDSRLECQLNYARTLADRRHIGIRQMKADVNVKTLGFDNLLLHNIAAAAQYSGNSLQATVAANDPALSMEAAVEASIDLADAARRMPQDIAVNIDARNIQPNLLHLTNKYGNGRFAFKFNADAEDLRLENLKATLSLRDFTLTGDNTNPVPYHLKSLVVQAEPQSNGNHIRLRSDFADLDYSGSIVPDSLKSMLTHVSRKIESGGQDSGQTGLDRPLVADNAASGMQRHQAQGGRYNFALVVKDMTFFNRMLHLNTSQRGAIQVQLSALQDGSFVTMSALAPELSFGKVSFSNMSLYAHSNEGSFNMLGKVSKRLKNGELQAEMTAVNSNGKIVTDIEWDEVVSHTFYGKVSMASQLLFPEAGVRSDSVSHFAVNTEFLPSIISLGDSLWNVSNGTIAYKDHKIAIENVGISHADQRLSINGTYDRYSKDTIVVALNKIDLDYALAFAHLNVVDFGGHATGKIFVRQLPNGHPWAKAEIQVPDFTFNRADFGHADVSLGWNHEASGITIQGYMEEPGIGYTRVSGYVDPINRDLDLHTESKNTQLAFLNKYTAGIFEDISGRATGNCRIYGPFKEIVFSGKEVASCQATIPVTGVTYHVADATVNVEPEAFVFSGATIRDNFTGAGTVEGTLRHSHLQNMTYDFRLNGNNLRMYEKSRELDMPFFATATGSGDVHITGVPGKMNADIRISTTPGSELTYVLDSPDADVSQLLSLRDATKTDAPDEKAGNTPSAPVAETSGTEFNLYFEVDVEDQSRLNLITDDKSGDVITVYGAGPIQAIYHNRSGFQMFGTYNIQRGTYGLNIPSLAQRKKFDILSGGRVQFSGDPTEAEVNVHAQYVVNSASLADLNIGTGFANNTTRVNCIVDIFGEVANMQFNLDFELPNCSEDEQQMVRQLIASEEDRTRQVLYLLGVGRFYAYNYSSNELGQSQSVLMMNSLLSTTLSSQLNNIISNAVGNNNWTFGTNISTGQLGWNDMEVEGLVSSRLLNNRLLINGNFGYSERQAATTNFVGDFDVQYLITPKGNVSVRAYSETNDRYFTKSTLTTQGVGVQLKRDFTHFISLFRKSKQRNKNKK